MKTFYRYHPTIGIYQDTITFDDEAPKARPVTDSDSITSPPPIPIVTDPVVPFSTPIEPPKTKTGEFAFFEKGSWVVKKIQSDTKNQPGRKS